jgi:hypothetical protein
LISVSCFAFFHSQGLEPLLNQEIKSANSSLCANAKEIPIKIGVKCFARHRNFSSIKLTKVRNGHSYGELFIIL